MFNLYYVSIQVTVERPHLVLGRAIRSFFNEPFENIKRVVATALTLSLVAPLMTEEFAE
jgi:hypothetical protein